MSLLNPQQLDTLSTVIEGVEKKTDAELLVVIARKADKYLYIPTLWAAMIALLAPLILKFTPPWLEGDDLLLAQYLIFVAAASAFRILPITMLLVPKRIKFERASQIAHRQFLENNVHATLKHTGVLIFVSEAERYVEIIADSGISQFVENDRWQSSVDQLIQRIKVGDIEKGLIACIEECGELLSAYAPVTYQKNELPNHLVIL